MRVGQRHSSETRRRIAETHRAIMASPQVRQKISEGTRAATAPAHARQKISERTKEALGILPELVRLRDAWRLARPSVRRTFVYEVLAPMFNDVGQP
jgi:hypothetical protein